MSPAAVLAVIVKAQGITETNAKLASVQKTLEKTESKTTQVGDAMVKTGKKMSSVGKSLSRDVTAPLVGIGVAAGVMSAKYHRSMNLIATDAGGSKREVKALSGEVLKLAEHSEFGPQKLADSLFFIESAGLRGAKAIKALSEIQRAAMSGNADLEHAVFGTMGAYNALGKEGENINKILATQNAIVGHGHLRLEELTQAMSTGFLGVGKRFGLTFEGMGSALAFFTRMSEPAQQAATRMRQTIVHLGTASTEKAEEAMNSIGMNFAHMGDEIERTHRLFPVLDELKKHLAGLKPAEQRQILVEAFGGGRFGTQIQEALNNLGLLYKTEKEIAKTATLKRLHHSERIQEESDAVKLKILWSQIEVALIKLGDAILPVFIPIFTTMVHYIMGVTSWFDHLSHSTKTWIVVIGMALAVLGPLLVVLGSLIKNGGYVVQMIGKIIDKFAATKAVTDEVVVQNEGLITSYGEVADAATASAATQVEAIQSVADAQKVAEAERLAGLPIGGLSGQQTMAPIMPAAEEGAQMSLFAQPATEAAADVGPAIEEAASPGIMAAGASMVSSLGAAIGFNFPTVIAALGLANILKSVLGGEMGKAGEQAGGALVGGIIGAFVGGPAGALVGAGIGSAIGPPVIGAIKNLFGAGGPVETQLEHSARGLSNALGHHLGHLQSSLVTFHGTDKGLHKSKQQAIQASKQLERAESKLERARHTNSGARTIAKDEAKVRLAKLGVEHANRKVTASEQLQGEARNRVMQFIRATVQLDKQRIKTSQKTVAQLYKELKAAQENGANGKRISHILGEITRAETVQTSSKKNLLAQYERANTQIGPKFAHAMRNIKTISEEVTEKERRLSKETKGLQLVPNSLQNAITSWKKNRSETEKAGTAVHQVTEKYGPFKSESHTAMRQATKDVQSFTSAGTQGLGAYGSNLNSFASQLGIANVHFTIGKAEKSKPHKKLGGMVVPGSGTGDKVPLTAMVEPGEIVHVLNKKASKKLGALEAINNQYPRFKKGGAMGGGTTAAAMAEAKKINAAEYPYVWGGGHGSFAGPYDCSGAVSAVLHAANLLSKPMVSGELANFGAPGPGPITIYANGVHAFMSIMGKFFGTSGSNPGGGAGFFPSSIGLAEAHEGDSGGAFSVRHPTGAGVMELAKEMFKGPAGQLQKTGQESMNLAQKMGNKWLQKNMPGAFGGGDKNIAEGTANGAISKIVAASAAKYGVPFWIEWGIAGAESTWGKGGSNLFGLLAAAEGANISNWKSASEQSARTMARLHREDGTWEAAMRAYSGGEYGLQHVKELFNQQPANFASGGTAELSKGKTKKNQDPISKSTKNVLEGLKKGKHLPKYHGALNKLGRHIDGMGLNKQEFHRLGVLQSLTNEVAKYQEYAENASTLTHSIETGEGKEEVIQGIFKGSGEGTWLNKVLSTLLNLRQHVVAEVNTDSPQLPHVKHLLKEQHVRLRAVQKAIREAERQKRELEKKIKEVEHAANQSKKTLEKEITEKEHELSKAEKQKNPNKGTLEGLRGEIHTRKEAISGSDKTAHEEIGKLKDHVRSIEKAQHARHRVESALTGTIIPKLDTKESSIAELLQGLRGSSGEVEGKGKHISFSGLATIQGSGTGLEAIGNPPPLGSVGGEIFTVQNRLREIQEEAEKAKTSGSTTSESENEAKQMAEEIALEWKKKYLVLEAQTRVLQEMPSVQALNNPPGMPFAGSFAMGGVARARGLVLARVGERGEEIVAPPQGARVIPSHEVKQALAGGNQEMAAPVFEEIHFHEAEQKVTGRMNGREFEQKLDKGTRKKVLRSMSRTPGGKGIKK